MNKAKLCLLSMLFLGVIFSVYSVDIEGEGYTYRQEFRDLLASSEVYGTIFTKGDPECDNLREIRHTIVNYKEKADGYGVLPMLLAGGVAINSQLLPKLHALVERICVANNMAVPKIFISIHEHFFNAAANRLLLYQGNIIIGKELLEELSDQMLEGIIAHELGHVKYNHINKTLALNCALSYTLLCMVKYFNGNKKPNLGFFQGILLGQLVMTCAQLLIGKRFEKQADEFAYKNAQRGPGLLKALCYMGHRSAQKNRAHEAALTQAYMEIESAAPSISGQHYLNLRIMYALRKLLFNVNETYRWVYHNTRLGPHPSFEERERAIQEYLHEQVGCDGAQNPA